MIDKVEIRGIRQLGQALKKVDSETPKRLKKGFLDIAGKVVENVQAKVPRRGGDARASVKPKGTQKGAGIAFGGTKAPYYPWLDFGGSTGKGHQPRMPFSGAIQRPFIKTGRYVYPTISDMNDEIKDDVDELLAKVIRSADFDTKDGGL